MSDGYDYFAAPRAASTFGGPATSPLPMSPTASQPFSGRPGRRLPRGLLWGLGGVAVLAVVLTGWRLRPVDHQRPVVLPEKVLGASPAQGGTDFGTDALWLKAAADDLPGVAVEGRGYSAGQGTRPLMINVVVARTDMTGKLDRRLAVEPYTSYGSVSCSHTFDLSTQTSPNAAPSTTPNMALCWRTSRGLSVSIMVLGQGSVTDAQIAGEVQSVWDLQPDG